jgi:hypothetical protein
MKTWLMPRLTVCQRSSRQLSRTNLDYSIVQVFVPCPVTECEWTLIFLNLESMIQFDGSKFVVKRPSTKSSKANPQFKPKVPTDIEKGTTPRQQPGVSSNHVIHSTDEDVAPFETPRVLKKTKRTIKPASEIESISDEEKNEIKSVKKGQNKGKNKRVSVVVIL